MKNIFIYILFAGILMGGLSACRKYVEIDTYTSRTLKYTSDYALLMKSRDKFESVYLLPLITCDDIETTNTGIQNAWSDIFKKAYVWSESFYTEEQQDNGWGFCYSQIYIANEVIAGVMGSQQGTEAEKKSVYAEALVQRAFAYWFLVNMYAPVYTANDATSKEGVPLLLAPDLYQPLNRASLQTVYDQIIKDTEAAIADLPNLPAFNSRPSKASAYALLARTYLMMGNFSLAAENAGKSLAIQNTLNNLATYSTNISTYPRKLADPEVIQSKLVAGYAEIKLNDELLNLFEPGDLRYSMFTVNDNAVGGRRGSKHQVSYEGRYVGPSVPEMLLIDAEYYARNSNAEKVNELLNKLRANRFTAAAYVPLNLTASDNLLQYVLKERRREMMNTGMRWFDQRRLSVEPAFASTITRVFNGQTYTLAPGSNRFIYPIAPNVIKLNPEIGQSPR